MLLALRPAEFRRAGARVFRGFFGRGDDRVVGDVAVDAAAEAVAEGLLHQAVFAAVEADDRGDARRA